MAATGSAPRGALAVGERPRKSLLASGALSFFLGPLGWLYAGSFREAIPASLVYVLVTAILPKFLLVYILGLTGMASAAAGVLYAWSYNRSGRRETLILKDAPASLGETPKPPSRSSLGATPKPPRALS